MIQARELVERYLKERSTGWMPATQRNARRALAHFLAFLEGRALTRAAVLACVAHVQQAKTRLGRPWSPYSVLWVLGTLRRLLAWAVLRGLLLEDLSVLVPCPRIARLPRSLSEADAERLVEAGAGSGRRALSSRDRALIELLYGTGLRAAEAARLELHDVDLQGELLHVRQGKRLKDRVVPLGARLREALVAYLRDRPRREGPLFLTQAAQAMARTTVTSIVAAAAKRAGLAGPVSPHRLRHSCATHLLRNGASLPAIQKLLGHATLLSTEVYLQVDVSDLAAMIRKSHPRERRRR
jgi:integrase/recombinase XerD